MHEVLVNRLGGLSLPRKSVARLTDRPDKTLDVYRGRKTTIQQHSFLKVSIYINVYKCSNILYYLREQDLCILQPQRPLFVCSAFYLYLRMSSRYSVRKELIIWFLLALFRLCVLASVRLTFFFTTSRLIRINTTYKVNCSTFGVF